MNKKSSYYPLSFEKLDVWKSAIALTKNIYTEVRKWPESEKYGLISQIKRASNSISLNLAEGSGKFSLKEQAKFSNIAYCSALEVVNAITLAKELNYIEEVEYHNFRSQLDPILKSLLALRKSQLRRFEQEVTRNP